MEENSKVPVMKAALIYGAITGFVSIVVSVVFNLLDITFESWAGLVSFVILVGVVVYCLYAYRNEYLGGYADYGKLLLMSVFIGIVSTVLVTIYTYINLTIIDPEYTEKMYNMVYNKMLENPKITDEMLDIIMERMESRFTVTRVLIQGIFGGIMMTVLIGAIASAFLKKKQDGPAEYVA